MTAQEYKADKFLREAPLRIREIAAVACTAFLILYWLLPAPVKPPEFKGYSTYLEMPYQLVNLTTEGK